MKRTIVGLLFVVIAVGACSRVNETSAPEATEAGVQDEPNDPFATPTKQQVVQQPNSFIGLWKGTTMLVLDGETQTERVVTFEISDKCVSSELCLYAFSNLYSPIVRGQEGYKCYGNETDTFCFAPIDENTLDYFGGSTQWAESAKLQKVQDLIVIERITAKYLALSPNGQFLAYGCCSDLDVFSTNSWTKLWSTTGWKTPGGGLNFSPDSNLLAVTTGHQEVYILDALTGEILQTLEGNREAQDVFWSDDGSLLAIISPYFWVEVWNTTTWEMIADISTYDSDLLTVSFSENGKRLLVADDARLREYDTLALTQRVVEEKTLPWPSEFPEQSYYSATALASDGSVFATSTGPYFSPDADGETYNIELWNTRTGEHQLGFRVESRRMELNLLVFSPDDSVLAGVLGSTLLLWDTSSGALLNSLEGHKIYNIAWLPDGKSLVIGGSGELLIWEINSGL